MISYKEYTMKTGREHYFSKSYTTMLSAVIFLLYIHHTHALPVTPSSEKGVWGEWSGWSNCSRTCGAGVSMQTRTCMSGSCVGERVTQYRSCCIEECAPGSPDFREQQCQQRTKKFPQNIEWVPPETDSDECRLICVPRSSEGASDTSTYITSYVDPGTPCKTTSRENGVCLGTMCATVGCDNVLGSLKSVDECHQCVSPGGSENCVEHSNTYLSNLPENSGDLQILDVPTNATTITLKHLLKPNQGKLALKSTSGVYFFSGGPHNTPHHAAGAVFHYTVETTGSYPLEILTSPGPLTEALSVELLDVYNSSPEVEYTYYLLSQTTPTVDAHLDRDHDPSDPDISVVGDEDSEEAVYMWKYGSFDKCSVSCGTGLQTAHALCRDAKYPDRALRDDYCLHRDLPKPLPIQQKCNCGACPPRWVAGDWSECSAMCGGGVQKRTVECHQFIEQGKQEVLDNSSLCSDLPKPSEERACNTEQCPFTWKTEDWSECSAPCGEGTQRRDVMCIDTATNLETDSSHCSFILRPQDTRSCEIKPCQCFWWTSPSWRKCDNTCGYGVETRRLRCRYRSESGKLLRAHNESCCEGLPVPEIRRECWNASGSKCHAEWHASDYGECAGNCCNPSEHKEVRTVLCVAIRNGDSSHRATLPDEACNASTKPVESRPCQRRDCPHWVTGEYGACSTTCGNRGLHIREVACVQSGVQVGDDDCRRCPDPEINRKPTEFLPCDNQPTCPPSTTTPGPMPTPTPTPPECVDRLDFCADYVATCSSEYFQYWCCKTCKDVNDALAATVAQR